MTRQFGLSEGPNEVQPALWPDVSPALRPRQYLITESAAWKRGGWWGDKDSSFPPLWGGHPLPYMIGRYSNPLPRLVGQHLKQKRQGS